MKTKIDVEAASGSYTVLVACIDGSVLKLSFDPAAHTAEAARFLIEAFSQERLDAINEAHKRTLAVLDKVAADAAP